MGNLFKANRLKTNVRRKKDNSDNIESQARFVDMPNDCHL